MAELKPGNIREGCSSQLVELGEVGDVNNAPGSLSNLCHIRGWFPHHSFEDVATCGAARVGVVCTAIADLYLLLE